MAGGSRRIISIKWLTLDGPSPALGGTKISKFLLHKADGNSAVRK